MRRVYVCPVVGDGSEENSFRSLVSDLIGEHISLSAAISLHLSGRDRGKPRLPWTLVRVEAEDFTAVDADARCIRVMAQPAAIDDLLPQAIRDRLKGDGVLKQKEADEVTRVRPAIELLHEKVYPEQDHAAWARRAADG